MLITAEGITDVGRVRISNQDSLLVDCESGIFIVADGMGGHRGGEVASRICVDQIRNFLEVKKPIIQQIDDMALPSAQHTLKNFLAQAINQASLRIYERSLEEPDLKGMGTTAIVLLVHQGYAIVGHVGDSRLYLLRSRFLYQITNDHSLVNEQFQAGLITKEEAETFQLKNIITRSVGYQEEEDVDTACFPLEVGDLLLLCSDGLHGKLSNSEIYQQLILSASKSAQRLVDQANALGGDDNITVIMVEPKEF